MTFCAILSNLLENAMHAVTKLPVEKRIVHLSIFEKGNHLLILQKNPASETPVFQTASRLQRQRITVSVSKASFIM